VAARAIFIGLIVFVFSGNIHADDPQKLPSRKASVVLPLLRQLTIRDTSYFSHDSPLSEIDKILGPADSGLADSRGATFSYWLDDKTEITVYFRTDQTTGPRSTVTLARFEAHAPGKNTEIFYPKAPALKSN
jgi:hypothetical protein